METNDAGPLRLKHSDEITRPVLPTLALYFLATVISLATIVKPAKAEGTVAPVSTSFFVNGVAYNSRVDACQAYADSIYAGSTCQYGSAAYCSSGLVPWQATSQSRVNPTNNQCQWGRFEYLHSVTGAPDAVTFYDIGYLPGSISCPGNSSLTGTSCTCKAGLAPDPTATSCVPVANCTVNPLPALPKDDLCTNSLEAGRGKDINHACSSKLMPEMRKQANCLADKIHALGLAYTEPSATIRTEAYQNHLLAVWNKHWEIESRDLSALEQQVCASIIADVNSEMEHHGIESNPSTKGAQAPHVQGRAVDIPRSVAKEMMKQVTNTTFVTIPNCLFCIPFTITTIGDVQDYVNSATVYPLACNLHWGGRFEPVDKVHFQLP